jgi:class 3 adenylate cyclase
MFNAVLLLILSLMQCPAIFAIENCYRDVCYRDVTFTKMNGTFLFTDLQDSSQIYDEEGDDAAYSLVHYHFHKLKGIIKEHKGVLVKTIGDAVMAHFPDPYTATEAAVHMVQDLDSLNQELHEKKIKIKIGIHQGSVIEVRERGRKDYFGQTVNMAARVQGLADGEELYVTKTVYDYPGVSHFLAFYLPEKKMVQIRGIKGDFEVYRISLNHPIH